MKLFIRFIVFLCICNSSTYGQIKFFKVFSNDGYDYGQGITQLADSSYMVTGSSSSFQEGPSQVFMLKLNKFGDYQWSKNYGGTETDWGKRILNWNDSIFYMVGYSTALSGNDYDAYLIKCDKNGNQLLEKRYDNIGWDKINDALLTSDSTIYMVGETTSTINGNSNYYIIKADKNGDTLWTKNFGSSGNDILNSIEQLNDSIFYAVGESYNSDSSFYKATVIRFHRDGTIYFQKEYGEYGSYSLNDFYFIGTTLNAVGHRKHPIDGDKDEYHLIIDQDGTFVWEVATHVAGDVVNEQVCKYGNSNNIYISSSYQNEFSAGGSKDADITRYFDDFVWDMAFVSIGFPKEDKISHMMATNDGGAVATGFITVNGMGGSSAFVIKVGPNDNFPAINLNNVESIVTLEELENNNLNTVSIYPNPTNGIFKVNSNELEPIEIQIKNSIGQNIFNGEVSNGSAINTDEWEKGLYFISFESKDKRYKTCKLIIQ